MSGEVIKWLNEQHPWLQETASRILSKGTLDDRDVSDLVLIIKAPITQGVTQERDYPRIESPAVTTDIIRLVSIGEVQNIENLAPRNSLVFGSGNLCVVYGCNGSGKSGYVRILKKACGKPGANELNPNVYKPIPTQQSCMITYDINGRLVPIQWVANGDPITVLASLDIFDTLSGRAYIDDESEPSYVPAELAFFSDLVKVSKTLEKVLDTEQAALGKKLPEIPAKYSHTETWRTYIDMSLEMEPSKLKAIMSWTEEESKKLADLNSRLKTVDPSAEARKRRNVKIQIDRLISELNAALLKVDVASCSKLIELRQLATEKRRIASESVKALSSIIKLDGIGNQTWRALWFAARDYSISAAYKDKPYPNLEGPSLCVLCHQSLDQDAKNRLRSLESFVTGKLQSEALVAETLLNNSLLLLPKIPDIDALKSACQAAELSDEVQKTLETIWLKILCIVELLKTVFSISDISQIEPGLLGVITTLRDLSRQNEDVAVQYDNDSKSFDRNTAASEVLNLQAKEWTFQQSKAISAEIDRLRQLRQYDGWKKSTGTMGISKKAGELSEILITDAYIARFNVELQKLGAKNISVELVKTRVAFGHSKHQVLLKGLVKKNIKTSEILSEGENRIVSLAAFLADVTGKHSASPFIFDDPISSLDQSYEEKTIDRLVELSQNRQVLIFTNRLSFLGMINDRADPNILSIRCEPWGTGEPGELPIFGKKPDGALRNLKNDRLSKARKVLQSEGNDAYYPLAKSICSDIRILMERIVETVFLADVIQRHRREVQTKDKVNNLCKIQKEDCAFVDEIVTKYSRYEHSQSSEAPVEVPQPDDLTEDIDKILSWHDEFKGRE
ncbi:restriction endonuclease [bacterium]|nr:restriction endonuclease [bacterium]